MTEREEFVRLGWCILERKCAYYEMEKGMPQPPPDFEYDQHERRYLELAERLKLKPTAHVVGFPKHRPSGRLVYNRLKRRHTFTPWPERGSTVVPRRTLFEDPPARRVIPRRTLARRPLKRKKLKLPGFFS